MFKLKVIMVTFLLICMTGFVGVPFVQSGDLAGRECNDVELKEKEYEDGELVHAHITCFECSTFAHIKTGFGSYEVFCQKSGGGQTVVDSVNKAIKWAVRNCECY